MTDDLVKRLRDLVNDDDTEMLAWEAADRIEQLEAALRQIAWQRYGEQLNAIDNYNALQSVARAALEGKKDKNS